MTRTNLFEIPRATDALKPETAMRDFISDALGVVAIFALFFGVLIIGYGAGGAGL